MYYHIDIYMCYHLVRMYVLSSWYTFVFSSCYNIQPIADRAALNLEIIFENFQFSTRRTKILMGFTVRYLVLIVNPMCRILVR